MGTCNQKTSIKSVSYIVWLQTKNGSNQKNLVFRNYIIGLPVWSQKWGSATSSAFLGGCVQKCTVGNFYPRVHKSIHVYKSIHFCVFLFLNQKPNIYIYIYIPYIYRNILVTSLVHTQQKICDQYQKWVIFIHTTG
jgi:hypothetical protein